MTPYIEAKRETEVQAIFSDDPKVNPFLHVKLFVTGADGRRFRVHAYTLPNSPKARKLVGRIAAAWEASAFYRKLYLAQDVNGNDYVTVRLEDQDYAPFGRTLNADLKRMGY